MKTALGANNHPPALVEVKTREGTQRFVVHVARLRSAVNAAYRRFPDALAVEVSRKEVP